MVLPSAVCRLLTNTMDSLIETFHIDIKLLIAQAINFAIVISVLYFFALKPLIKVMKDRTVKIEKSLEDAKKIDAKLDKTETEYKETLAKAKKEANEIIEQAKGEAEEKKQEMINDAKSEIGEMINKGKETLQQEKQEVLKEAKADIADLVLASVEKVLDKKMDGKEDKEIIKKIVK